MQAKAFVLYQSVWADKILIGNFESSHPKTYRHQKLIESSPSSGNQEIDF